MLPTVNRLYCSDMHLIFVGRECESLPNQYVVSRHSDSRGDNSVLVQFIIHSLSHAYNRDHQLASSNINTFNFFINKSQTFLRKLLDIGIN